MDVLLSCGCRANSTNCKGEPSCAIHAGLVPDIHEVEDPNLDDRVARCYCGLAKPSSLKLAFFVYRGEGSPYSKITCKNCRYHEIAHTKPTFDKCKNFEPHGAAEYDEYYCGCRGWD